MLWTGALLEVVGFALLFWAVFKGAEAAWAATGAARPALLASSTTAGLHGLVMTFWAGALLWGWDGAAWDEPNTRQQSLALALSTAYFVADSLVYLAPYAPKDHALFQLHHVVTVAYLAGSLQLGRCAKPVLLGLFIGGLAAAAAGGAAHRAGGGL